TAGTLTVLTAATTTTITSTNVSSTYNSTTAQTVMLTASVTSSNGGTVHEGAVTFTVSNPNGANLTATGNVTNGTATATLTVPAAFAAGTYSFNANYADTTNANGVTNYVTSTAPAPGTLTVLTVQMADTTTTITSTAVSSTYNSTTDQKVTLTASVASSNGGTVNEGTVTFTVTNPNGTNLTATGNVTNGTATATLTVPAAFAAGSYTLSASYSDTKNANGIVNYATSTATVPGTLTVQSAATQTTITSTAVSSTYNSTTDQTVTLTATVASADGGTIGEGKILFVVTIPNNNILTAPADVSDGKATATLTVPAGLAAGNYAFSADYFDSNNTNGILNYIGSGTPASGTLTVQAAASQSSVTVTSPVVTFSLNGQTVTVTATIASGNGGAVHEGNVTFTVNGVNLGTAAVNGAGQAVASLQLPGGLALGGYTLTARYADNTNANSAINFAASSGTAGLTITPANTTATITQMLLVPVNGVLVELVTVSVTSPDGPVNGGTVTLNLDGFIHQAAVVNGQATVLAFLPMPAVGGAEYTRVSYTPSNVNFLASDEVRLLLLTIRNALDAGFALFAKDGSQIVATLIDNMSVGLIYDVHGQLTGFVLGLLPKLP
ncbi:MAG TPA: Ig-like domain repeat protein, partial [Gemmataceae bacterium]